MFHWPQFYGAVRESFWQSASRLVLDAARGALQPLRGPCLARFRHPQLFLKHPELRGLPPLRLHIGIAGMRLGRVAHER